MEARIKTSKAFVLAICSSLFGVLLFLTPAGYFLEEEYGLDWLFSLRGELAAPQEVAIISIDRATAKQLELPDDPEKWPRSIYARLLEKLTRQHPSIIAFNIIFDDSRNLPNDQMLANAMAEANNVILSNYLKRYPVEFAGRSGQVFNDRIIDPLPIFEQVALGTAPFLLPRTATTVKQFWTYKSSAGDIPTFPVSIFHAYVLKKIYPELRLLVDQMYPDSRIKLPESFTSIAEQKRLFETIQQLKVMFSETPLVAEQTDQFFADGQWEPEKVRLLKSWLTLMEGEESLYFNHYGPARTIVTIPLHEVLSTNLALDNFFHDKLVFIGYSENLEPERNRGFYTAFSRVDGDIISPVEIAATAVGNLVNQSWLRAFPYQYQLLLLIAWSFLLATLCRLFNFKQAIVLIVGVSIGYLLLTYYLFNRFYFWLPYFIPLVVQTPLVLMLIGGCHFQTNSRQRRTMQKAIGFYLPDDVVNKMTEQHMVHEMGRYGELKYGVCMATDAGQYTTLAEAMAPMLLGELMNEYYAEIFKPVKKHGGIVSDVIGDAMLAIWATANAELKPRLNACLAALEIKHAISNFNLKQDKTLPTRMGLHYGAMRMGNVGAEEHFEYRAVGDIVNTATRIEGLNKALGTSILASEATMSGLSGFITREAGVFILKGKKNPLVIYELIGLHDEESFLQQALLDEFCEALQLFKNCHWQDARRAFAAVQKKFPDDGLTHFYVRYLQQQTIDEQDPAPINISSISSLF